MPLNTKFSPKNAVRTATSTAWTAPPSPRAFASACEMVDVSEVVVSFANSPLVAAQMPDAIARCIQFVRISIHV